MQARAEQLQLRIELFRRYLGREPDAELAAEYRRQIAEDEAELAKIEKAAGTGEI